MILRDPSGPGKRVATPPEALELAKRYHRAGEHDKAQAIYRQIVKALPDYADALHYFGVFHHQRGQSEKGVALIRRALAIKPDDLDALNNLGNVLSQCRRHEDATESFGAVLALDPDHLFARANRGMSLQALGRLADAEEDYRRAIALSPRYGNPRQCLFDLLLRANRTEEAAQSLRDWVEADPDNAVAAHLLVALSGENVPERASSDYVSATFDQFAESFDQKLALLGYRAPELVLAALGAAVGPPAANLAILDAGCGTGLCGPGLRRFAKRLVGVDLSREMLARAALGNAYHDLRQAELTEFLAESQSAYEAIVSADTLCYFGRLESALAAALEALRPGGVLVFTVEEQDGPEPIVLNQHGRYAHAMVYVDAALGEAGFVKPTIARDVLRQEAGTPVRGLVVTATAPA